MNDNYPIGWEEIGSHPHKRNRLIERVERIDHFKNVGIDMMLDHIIGWDDELIHELNELAYHLECAACGAIYFDYHETEWTEREMR